MPLYEYQCKTCGERIEIIQKHSDPVFEHCPKCGGAMRKLHSAPAIHFKGTGFYKTDYSSKPSASSESRGEAAAETKPEAKLATKSETKSTKSETKSEGSN